MGVCFVFTFISLTIANAILKRRLSGMVLRFGLVCPLSLSLDEGFLACLRNQSLFALAFFLINPRFDESIDG